MGHKRRGRFMKKVRQADARIRDNNRARLTPEQQIEVLKDRPGLSRAEVLKLRERMKILVGPLHG